jgi:hypothetical protein
MKLFIGSTLFLLLAGAPAFAGQEPDKDKPKEEPKKQEEPRKAPKPAEKPKPQPAAHPQDNDHPKPEAQPKASPPKPAQHQDNHAQDQQRAKQTEQHSDHNAQPANANVRRVPEAKYRASFGPEHHFHVQRGGNRFNYGGFWFNYSEPWPGDWDYNDDVYIEDIDGQYYLLNPRHPGIRLIVVIGD